MLCVILNDIYQKFLKNSWSVPPIMESLKAAAKDRGLFNLFFQSEYGDIKQQPLSNVEYAPLCELMGTSIFIAPEVSSSRFPRVSVDEVVN